MDVNKRIRQARLDSGYSENLLAHESGLSVYELGDIEARPDEFSTGVPAQNAIRLCRKLALSVNDCMDLPDEVMAPLPANLSTYIQTVRLNAGLSAEELDERIGYEIGFIGQIELGLLDLSAYPLVLAIDIADQTHSSRSLMLKAMESLTH